LLSALCLVPFLNKAYTIDDPYFLRQAEQILKTPLHPMTFELCWFGKDVCETAAASSTNMALGGYSLVPLILTGGAEWLAHLQQLLILWVGIFATVLLALRLGMDKRAATFAGLILASLPPVLMITSTVMPDTIAMSLSVLGAERLVAWKTNRKLHQAISGSIAIGLAAFGRPQLILIVPVIALLLRDDGCIFDLKSWFRIPARLWLPLLAAPVIWILLIKLTSEPGGGLGPPRVIEGIFRIWPNLRTYLTYWVTLTPLGIFWFALQAKSLRYRLLWLFPVALMLVWKMILVPAPDWMPVARMLGAVTIANILCYSLFTRNKLQIACGAWLLIGLPTALHIHMPPRYLAASGPAIALLLAALLIKLPSVTRTLALGVILIVSTVTSVLLLKADADFAEIGRKAAAQLIAPRVRAGKHVWYSGQWGYYWYASKAGALVFNPVGPQPQPGELMVLGYLEGGNIVLPHLPHRTLLERKTYFGSGGRTVSPANGVCFHSNSLGEKPWAWLSGELNHYDIWRVEPSI
jgi:hypothetical protein